MVDKRLKSGLGMVMTSGSPVCFLLLVAALALHVLTVSAFAIGVVDTKHNLSIGGPGSKTSSEEIRVCIFCHTPHHANAVGDYMPLWSRELSGANYTLYDSSTIQAEPGQPTGSSRLCLSCHDGTIALGMLSSGFNLLDLKHTGLENLTTDLSDDHPISFVYDMNLALTSELQDPSLLPNEIQLEEGRLECSSCHDAHFDFYGMFLVMDNVDSALCEACHARDGWTFSAHAPPNAKCESCHIAHTAPQSAGLLLGNTEEETCISSCHDGTGVEANVTSDFAKFSSHPLVSSLGVHDPAEDPLTADYHVECADCHNPHQANATAAEAPDASGALKGVAGVDSAGTLEDPAIYQYEVCFKCHADNSFLSVPAVDRQIDEVNERLRFSPDNPSYHPVIAAGKNSSVPSLRTGYTVNSIIYCTDCHNSDSSTYAGGTGANGPHGSSYDHILVKRYEQGSYPLAYAELNYDLCWQCHDPAVLMLNGSFHFRHVSSHQAPCSACHDPHGIPIGAIGGASGTGGTYLINFDTDIVTGTHDSGGRSCSVSCHTTNPKTY